MNTFKNEQYTITTSLTDHSIYMKIINNVSYMCYEGNFDKASFKLPFQMKEIHQFINHCFANEPSYSVNMQLNNGILMVGFEGVVGGFLTVQFDLRLHEKLMSNDAQLTINFQRIEQKQQHAFEELAKRMAEMERRLEALGSAEINFHYNSCCGTQKQVALPIDSKCVTIDSHTQCNHNQLNPNSFAKIKYFYQLDELTLINCASKDARNDSSSQTVKKLTLKYCSAFKDISFIKNFSSLVELSMSGTTVDSSIVTTLRSIKHKIKKLTFQGCSGINQTEMQTYCTQNGIELSLF